MIGEVLQRLRHIEKLEEYRYIGFGSIYFSDFSLFHRNLNITKMISIEKDGKNKERFEFNAPFRCIELKIGESVHVLPKLKWHERTILWLDYDGSLDYNIFTDIETFVSQARSGSVIIISCNIEPLKEDPTTKTRLPVLKKILKEKTPLETREVDLTRANFGKYVRNVLHNYIISLVTQRNGPEKNSLNYEYKQLFNFQYSDNATMLTIGGLLINHEEDKIKDKLDDCDFQSLSFVRTGEENYEIDAPNLTSREISWINSFMPCDDISIITDKKCIPEKDIQNYIKHYRFYPQFVEIEI